MDTITLAWMEERVHHQPNLWRILYRGWIHQLRFRIHRDMMVDGRIDTIVALDKAYLRTAHRRNKNRYKINSNYHTNNQHLTAPCPPSMNTVSCEREIWKKNHPKSAHPPKTVSYVHITGVFH
eukprot:scaffold12414_cov84-Cyclotella_meneghiniana.AAC.12